MSIGKFILQRLTYFNRLNKKNEVIRKIVENNHFENNDVVNIHRLDPKNIGDFYCAPHHYFEQLKGKSLDIFDYKSTDQNILDNFSKKITTQSLIIGGGGLLNRSSFEKQMKMFESISQKGKKIVLWGVGHNEKDKNTFGKVKQYNIDSSKFGLVSVRDYNMKEEWVPCASCLHPILETKSTIKNEIGLIFHKKTLTNKKVLDKFKEYPSTSNTTSLEEIIQFIAETETIITDSYHAMYWSMLMGKKVMVFPNSSKFYSFKYQPTISSIDNFQSDLKKVHAHSGILEECREINLKFAEKAFDYLGH